MTKNQEPVILKPGSPGLLCPYPGKTRRFLPEDGAPVVLNTWWRQRIRSGDAVIVADESEKTSKPKATKEAR